MPSQLGRSEQSIDDLHSHTLSRSGSHMSHPPGTFPSVHKDASAPVYNFRVPKSVQAFEIGLFYFTYWEHSCLPALHPIFHEVTRLSTDLGMLKEAVLGLSACNYSRRNPESKTWVSLPTYKTVNKRPDLEHQTRCLLYYTSALQKFSRLTERELTARSSSILAVLVIFSYIESSMGNYRGFNSHLQGISSYIEHDLDRLAGTQTGRQVLIAWMQSRYLVWWLRIYFSTLEFQRSQIRLSSFFDLRLSSGTMYDRRISVLSILCESHRLTFLDLLRHWDTDSEPEICIGPTMFGSIQQHLHYLLTIEVNKLNEWHTQLPQCEQPIHSFSPTTSPGANENGTFVVQPLYFNSYDAALNYAYYVVARIMQCTDLLFTVDKTSPHILGNECNDALPWIMILLRIVTAIDKKKAITQNAYTIGFSNLLLAASLRCQNLALGMWIENWLECLDTLHSIEEGSFPLFQTINVVKAINNQRKVNIETFGMSQLAEDDGGVPKYDAYNSQAINMLLFHGKCRDTGLLSTTCISVDG